MTRSRRCGNARPLNLELHWRRFNQWGANMDEWKWHRPKYIKPDLYNSPVYQAWKSMKQRCNNPKNKQWDDYGGRGITVCKSWKWFGNFYRDMGMPPPDTSLDRIDNDGNYEPGNCRWATKEEQDNNRRSNRNLTWKGRTQTVSQWARELGMNKRTLLNRLNTGWLVDQALTTPVKKLQKRN